MKKAIIYIILLFLLSGCISSEIEKGTPQSYELPGMNNTTIFYLENSSVKMIDNVVNATYILVYVSDDIDVNFEKPIAVDYSGNNVSFNISEIKSFGKKYAKFDFDSEFSGFIGLTKKADGQYFTQLLTKNSSVIVILPKGYTTGNRLFGIANPKPDNISFDEKGRQMLIWNSPYPNYKYISVRYYSSNAPKYMSYIFVFLLIAGIILYVYYYIILNSLKKK